MIIAIIAAAAAGAIAGIATICIIKAAGDDNQIAEAYDQGYLIGYGDGQRGLEEISNDCYNRGLEDGARRERLRQQEQKG